MKNQLYLLRIQKGLTIEQLHKMSGVAVGTISDLENGKVADPRTSTIKKLLKALEADGINPYDVLQPMERASGE